MVAPAQQAYASAYADRKAATEETIEGEHLCAHARSTLQCLQLPAGCIQWAPDFNSKLLANCMRWTSQPLYARRRAFFLPILIPLCPADLEHRAEFAAGAALGAAEKAPEAAATTAAGVQAGAQRALTAAEKVAEQAAEAGREAAEVGGLLFHIGWAATVVDI